MKKFLTYSFIGLVLGLSSCSDDNNENNSDIDAPLTDLSASTITFDGEGGIENFTVKYPSIPSATSDSEWITVDRISSSNNLHTFSVTAAENPLSEERTGYVTLTGGKYSETITVVQDGYMEPSEPPTEENQPLLGYKAIDISKEIKAGWNIGNTLEAIGGETAWGNPKINEAYVAGIKEAGFNAVRIPCSWDAYIIDENNTIDPAWLDRVNEVVGYVLDQDMYAIVNIHWDGGWLEENIGTGSTDALLNKQKTLWSQIADRLGHYNEKLLFAGLNEPRAGNEWGNSSTNTAAMKSLLDYEQAFVDAVRAAGGNNSTRTLVVQAPNTNINMANQYMKELPKDPSGDGYLMVEVHYYDPSDYTIMEKDGDWSTYVKFFWGKDFHQGGNRDCTWGEEADMLSQLKKMQSKFVNKGIPVIIGEYGAYPEEHISKNVSFSSNEIEIVKASREFWYKSFTKYARQTGVLPFVWDTGELINRNTGEVYADKQYIVDALIK